MADDKADLRDLKERFLLGMTPDPRPPPGPSAVAHLPVSLVHRGRLV